MGHYVILGWEVLCALAAFVLLALKCRLAQRKKYLPALIIVCSIVYALVYISGVKWLQVIAGGITAAQCLFYALILESCIQCGLIPTNTGYETLFQIGTLRARIVD